MFGLRKSVISALNTRDDITQAMLARLGKALNSETLDTMASMPTERTKAIRANLINNGELTAKDQTEFEQVTLDHFNKVTRAIFQDLQHMAIAVENSGETLAKIGKGLSEEITKISKTIP
jgi:hypothetical protein